MSSASAEADRARGAAAQEPGGGATANRWIAATTSILLLATLWAVTHPYHGIVHDGRLYTLQAMHALDPARFASDLFFKYGSQDSFSIFSTLYKPLVGALGPAQAHLIATIAGQALWFGALLVLMKTLFSRHMEFIAAAAGCAVVSGVYGGLGVFHYGEPFATPRVFAEALVMLALALAARRRVVGAGFSILIAGALHPIMALSGAAVLAVLAVLHDRRALAAIALAGTVGMGLALAHVAPFDRLLLRLDDAWFQIVRQRCGLGFIARWNLSDAMVVASAAVVLATAYVIASAAQRRLILAVGLASAGGVLVTLIGADLARDIFLVNIQPWRALWLVSLLANAWTGVLLVRTPRAWISYDLLLGTLVLGGVAAVTGVLAPVAIAVRIGACVMLLWERHRDDSAPRWARLAALLAAGIAAALFVPGLYGLREMEGLIRPLVGVLVAAVAGVLLFQASRIRTATVLLGAAIVLATAGVSMSDGRTSWGRFVETDAVPSSLADFVADSGELYWERGVELSWFKLQRPAYYSCLQGSGAMFFRGTAMEYLRRSAALSQLGTLDFTDEQNELCARTQGANGPLSSKDIARACSELPELDTLVLSHAIPGLSARQWVSPIVQRFRESGKVFSLSRYFRYDCAAFRTGSRVASRS